MNELTRRDFVAGATVAAAAGTVAMAARVYADEAPSEEVDGAAAEVPARDLGVVRICISVNDLAKSLGFFTNMLEFTQVGSGMLTADVVSALYGLEGEARYAIVKNEYQSTTLQLIEFDARTGACIRTDRPSWDPGYFDVAMRCDNNAAVHKHLTKLGYTYYCEPHEYTAEWSGSTVSEAVLCGVDDVPTTMIESVSEPRPEFDGLFKNMTDIAMCMSDLDASDAFYVGVLGLEKAYDEMLEDGLVDSILSLPEGTHTRMVYYSDPGGNTAVIEGLQFSIEGTSMADVAQPQNAGIFAMCYEVEDLEATMQKATDAGFTAHGEPVEHVLAVYGTVRSVLVDGFDGALAELFQRV